MDATSKKNLQLLLSKSKKSNAWKEKAAYELENEAWLKRSFFIALAVIKELNRRRGTQAGLASELGVSPQYMSKILKGKENLTLETIAKLERVLGIELMRVPHDFKENAVEIEVNRSRSNQIELRNLKQGVVARVSVHQTTMTVVHTSNPHTAAA
jgi:transcriptional regulator with XRE-family HTH domain